MSKEVLILGNGVSRVHQYNFIQAWQGEIWACNWAFKELIDGTIPRIDRIIGDKSAMHQAKVEKDKRGLSYTILSKSRSMDGIDGAVPIDIPQKKIVDSGTALVQQALYEGYEHIYLAGFDLGGKDLHVSNHERRDKTRWIEKWRQIANEYGLERVTFLGKDHKPFILSDEPSATYAQMYQNGLDHLRWERQIDDKVGDEVLILGNGMSRLQYENYINAWEKELWVCNRAFQEHRKLRNIHRVGTVHKEGAIEAIEYREKNDLTYSVYYRNFVPGYEGRIKRFRDRRGWSTGILMLAQAIYEDYKMVYLAGFDFGGKDLYQRSPLPGGNFIRQYTVLRKENPQFFKDRVRFVGGVPNEIRNA